MTMEMETRGALHDRDHFRGCMLGLAIGDALGMPVETMTRQEILSATHGAGITGFRAPLQTRCDATARLQPGQWTDDTQLALAIARSLVRMGYFNLAGIAAEHVVEYHKERRGWGGSTARGIAELAEGRREIGDAVLDPNAQGFGNGVAMKVAPLALFGITQDAPLRVGSRQWIQPLATLTHRDPCAAIGAQVIAAAVRAVVSVDLPEAIRRDDGEPFRDALWMHLVNAVPDFNCPQHDTMFTRIVDALHHRDALTAFAAWNGTSALVWESVPFVIAVVRAHINSFRDGVLAAVNAGGDTDSNGAMVGAMLGALHGVSGIPEEWVEELEARDEILTLADGLFDLLDAHHRRMDTFLSRYCHGEPFGW